MSSRKNCSRCRLSFPARLLVEGVCRSCLAPPCVSCGAQYHGEVLLDGTCAKCRRSLVFAHCECARVDGRTCPEEGDNLYQIDRLVRIAVVPWALRPEYDERAALYPHLEYFRGEWPDNGLRTLLVSERCLEELTPNKYIAVDRSGEPVRKTSEEERAREARAYSEHVRVWQAKLAFRAGYRFLPPNSLVQEVEPESVLTRSNRWFGSED